MRKGKGLRDWSDDDFEKIAIRGRKEARAAKTKGGRLAVRQASEKSYLASVETARAVLRWSGTEVPDKSSTAIGMAFNVLSGKQYGPEAKKVTRAMTASLTQHASCFYDGKCDAGVVYEVAQDVVKATKIVKRMKSKIQRSGI